MVTLRGEASQREQTMAGRRLPSTTIGIRAPRHRLVSRLTRLRRLPGRCKAQFAMFQGLVGTPTQQVLSPKPVLTLGHLKHLRLSITVSAAIATAAKLVRTGSKVSPTARGLVLALWVLLGRVCQFLSFCSPAQLPSIHHKLMTSFCISTWRHL